MNDDDCCYYDDGNDDDDDNCNYLNDNYDDCYNDSGYSSQN